MAMLSYPCMEESCVLHCASVTLNSATLLRTMLELTVELSKQKRKQAPTVNSSILLTSFQMNEWLFTRGEKICRLSERYEGEMECQKKKKKKKKKKKGNTLGCQICPSTREEKLCNIYLPLQRNSSGNNPCN